MPRRPTMADVARAAGVSKNTVSLAMRHDTRIPETTRRRIERVAARLGYKRHPVVGELMARLRCSQQPRFRSVLALVNANEDPRAFANHPTIPAYVRGCERQAAALGYKLDRFWMHDPQADGASLARVFRARGIRGALLVGLMATNRLPERFRPVIEQFPCIVTGVRTREPALSFACVDHHVLAQRAVETALSLGYRRPGLVLDRTIDKLVEGRFVAGYLIGQQALPHKAKLAPFLDVREARQRPTRFAAWMKRQRPDVLFTLYNEVRHWVEALGLQVPRDLGLIQLEWRERDSTWSGMNQHNDVVGEAAVDMLVGALHRGESGPPAFPLATLIGPSWTPGTTTVSLPTEK